MGNMRLENEVNNMREMDKVYKEFLEYVNMEHSDIAKIRFNDMGSVNYRRETTKLEIESFLVYLKEDLGYGIAIINKEEEEEDTFLVICEDFDWEEVNDTIRVWDEENSVEFKITNDTVLKENEEGELVIDNKFVLGYL